MKTCPRCTQTDPPSGFGVNVRRADGLSDYCRSCTRELDRQKYRRRKAREEISHRANLEHYVEPRREVGRFECRYCEPPLPFSSAAILEQHIELRHQEAPA